MELQHQKHQIRQPIMKLQPRHHQNWNHHQEFNNSKCSPLLKMTAPQHLMLDKQPLLTHPLITPSPFLSHHFGRDHTLSPQDMAMPFTFSRRLPRLQHQSFSNHTPSFFLPTQWPCSFILLSLFLPNLSTALPTHLFYLQPISYLSLWLELFQLILSFRRHHSNIEALDLQPDFLHKIF